MTRRNKLLKFTELLTFPNVYENFDHKTNVLTGVDDQEYKLEGLWNDRHFKNSNPIVLELGCGGGDYSIALGQRYPEINFIGVDIKGARIWRGARKALELKLYNVAFLRSKIEMLDNFFALNEIAEIWITFPDPFLKFRKANRRLTSDNFLKLYNKFLIRGGAINLKTDSDSMYLHTKAVIEKEGHIIEQDNTNIYDAPLTHDDLDIKTHYEIQHLKDERTIKYIRFSLNY